MFHSPASETKQQSDSTRTEVRPGYAPTRAQQQLARLHSTYGNQAVLRTLSRSAPVVQTKLAINQPGDLFEQEADRVADQVMRMSAPAGLQRKGSADEHEGNLSPELNAQPGILQRQPKPQPPQCPAPSQQVRQLPADFNTPDNVQALAEILWHEMGNMVQESIAVGSIVMNRLLKTKFHKVGQLKSFERKADPPSNVVSLACGLLTGQFADSTNGSENYFSPQSMPDAANGGCCKGKTGPCNIPDSAGKLDCKGDPQVVPGTDPPQKRFFPSWATPDKRQPQPKGTDPMLIQVYTP